jgi:GTP-binding protein YchF
MKIGITGLAQSGKTTLFHGLTSTPEEAHPAHGKRDAHFGIVQVPDERLDRIHELYPGTEKVDATIEYVDIAGFVRGSARQKGFEEKVLANLRNVDALLLVLRLFENDAVPHPEERIDPSRDLGIIEDELLFSDMAIIENRIQRLHNELLKMKDPVRQAELAVLEKCQVHIENESPLRELQLTDEEEKAIRGFQFLTAKPILLVLNIGEEAISAEAALLQEWREIAAGSKKKMVALSVHLEMEIAQLAVADRMAFQEEMGIKEPALFKMIRHSYDLVGLMSFFTVGDKEVRAWTIKKDTRAQLAAGAIHSDMERGFIRAEVVDFEVLSELGSLAKCKEKGVLRLEGKEYIVKDGDVITFRFNV